MKKINILIVMFAMIAAASAVRAQTPHMDFDGKLKPQSMHDIFTDSRQIIPSGALDQVLVPVPADPVQSPMPMIEPWHITPQDQCMMVCFPGVEGYPNCCGGNQNTYTWWPQPWQAPGACQSMPHNGTWYDMVYCGPDVDWGQVIADAQSQTESAKSARIFHPGLQQKLRDILVGYCDTYPEFAEVVLPMLKDGSTKITADKRFIYIINSKKVMRFSGEAPSGTEKATSSRGWGLSTWGAAASAAEAVYNAVNALNEYGSWPPVPDTGMADEINGPQHGSHEGSHNTYHDNNGDSNYDVSRSKK